MIRVILAKDQFGVPTKWEDLPSIDLERVPPRWADRIDTECAATSGFGISCYGDALWKLTQVRAEYLSRAGADERAATDRKTRRDAGETVPDPDPSSSADAWVVRSRDARDLGILGAWVALSTAGHALTLQSVYDGDDGALEYVEIADPLPVPKQPRDRQGKAKAGSAARRAAPASH